MWHTSSKLSTMNFIEIRVIGQMLSLSTATVLVHSFVLSRLNLFHVLTTVMRIILGLPQFHPHQLHLIQTTAAAPAKPLSDLLKCSSILCSLHNYSSIPSAPSSHKRELPVLDYLFKKCFLTKILYKNKHGFYHI